MRTAQPVDAWTAYFAILTEALSATPATRDNRRESDQPTPKVAVDRAVSAPAASVATRHAPVRRGLVERIDHWFWRQRQSYFERQLGKCSDIYELEARMRAFEQPSGNLF